MNQQTTEPDNRTLRRLFDRALSIKQDDIIAFQAGIDNKTVFSTGQRENCLVINFEDPRAYPYSDSLVHGIKIAFPYYHGSGKFQPKAVFGAWDNQPNIGIITDIERSGEQDYTTVPDTSTQTTWEVSWMLNTKAVK